MNSIEFLISVKMHYAATTEKQAEVKFLFEFHWTVLSVSQSIKKELQKIDLGNDCEKNDDAD